MTPLFPVLPNTRFLQLVPLDISVRCARLSACVSCGHAFAVNWQWNNRWLS